MNDITGLKFCNDIIFSCSPRYYQRGQYFELIISKKFTKREDVQKIINAMFDDKQLKATIALGLADPDRAKEIFRAAGFMVPE